MNQYLRRALLLFALTATSTAVSDAAPRKTLDSNYVRKFPGTLTARTYLGEKFSTYSLIDRASDRTLNFHPNSILGIGVGLTILGIGVNVSTRVPLHEAKIDRFGRTSRYDIQVHRYGPKLMLDFYFQRYRGFHLADKSEVTRITNPQEYPYFANLQGRSIGLSALHVFNGERYSLRALVNQQEWQVKSSGSALLGGSIFAHRFSEEDSSVIPRYYRYPDFLGGNKPKEIAHYGITVNGGYGYTLVLDKAGHFFIAAAGDVGAGAGYSSVRDTQDAQLTKIGPVLTGNLRAGGGYNSRKLYVGVYGIFHTDFYSLPYAESSMQSRQGVVRFVVARRFATRKRYLARQPKRVEQVEPPVPPALSQPTLSPVLPPAPERPEQPVNNDK